ncbi:hypothetical protein [Streptomyces sp. NPDC002276]
MAYEETGRPELALRHLVFAGESIDLDVVAAFLKSYPGNARPPPSTCTARPRPPSTPPTAS